MDRRRFMRAASAAAIMAPASRMRAGEAAPQSVPLAGRMWLITGCGGNVTVLDSSAGVLLVDGGSPAHSARLLAEVKRLTGKDHVHTLFNTHWHHDQIGSNLALGQAGTRIIAHEYKRLWLTTDVESRLDKRVY
jgi:glyoxylase-like metal-dependent hydrolase (beta-lactamase superfamily II)